MSDECEAKITIYLRRETFWECVRNDVTTILILVGPVLANELTLKSVVMNFLCAVLGLLLLLGVAITTANGQRIRADTAEEAIEKVRAQIERQS